MIERQTMIESLTNRIPSFSDHTLARLLDIFDAIETDENDTHYITYGKDDTEHLLSNPANEAWLRESIKEVEEGNTVTFSLEALRTLMNEH
jgi:hypothetical protein